MCRAVARVLPVLPLAHVGLVVMRTLLLPRGPLGGIAPIHPLRTHTSCAAGVATPQVAFMDPLNVSGESLWVVLLSASCSLLSRPCRLTCVLVLRD